MLQNINCSDDEAVHCKFKIRLFWAFVILCFFCSMSWSQTKFCKKTASLQNSKSTKNPLGLFKVEDMPNPYRPLLFSNHTLSGRPVGESQELSSYRSPKAEDDKNSEQAILGGGSPWYQYKEYFLSVGTLGTELMWKIGVFEESRSLFSALNRVGIGLTFFEIKGGIRKWNRGIPYSLGTLNTTIVLWSRKREFKHPTFSDRELSPTRKTRTFSGSTKTSFYASPLLSFQIRNTTIGAYRYISDGLKKEFIKNGITKPKMRIHYIDLALRLSWTHADFSSRAWDPFSNGSAAVSAGLTFWSDSFNDINGKSASPEIYIDFEIDASSNSGVLLLNTRDKTSQSKYGVWVNMVSYSKYTGESNGSRLDVFLFKLRYFKGGFLSMFFDSSFKSRDDNLLPYWVPLGLFIPIHESENHVLGFGLNTYLFWAGNKENKSKIVEFVTELNFPQITLSGGYRFQSNTNADIPKTKGFFVEAAVGMMYLLND